MINRRQFLGAAAGGTAALMMGQGRRTPNIVLIIADDLGYADLGCYGNKRIRTPHIDKVAAEGVRFTDFYVSWPACTPSRSSILTGRYPQRNGLYDMIRNNEVNWKYQFDEENYATSPEMTIGLDTREVTIGQAMHEAGYRTGLVGKWDSGRAKRFLPLQRGFDFFYGFANTGIDYFTHERYGIPSMFRGNERIKEEGHATDLFLREALRFIDDSAHGPFFLYASFNAPHMASTFDKSAHEVPEKYLKMYGVTEYNRKAEYAPLVTQLDDAVGAIMAKLKAHNVDDNTLVVFISDNGGDGGSADNGPLRGAKTWLYEGGIRVPMIARWPARIPAGKVNKQFASTLDLFPTFCAAAGKTPGPWPLMDGKSILPALEGKSGFERKEMYWQRLGDKAARVGDWKWVDSARGKGLYNLAEDIGEKHDLTAEKPEVAAMMKKKWADWRKEMDASEPRGPFRDY